ncbi:hypothetical protein H6F76_28490 [Leptolyngbya sp. FACHB-321]|uniref:hypothetical protein n=1 Tax=Leptolyngbya sp. FACHB-321 TaxID=2692807 RepID=UPI001685F388|nr:hypothetical protein [Leptolyngbya sp. FACHB-321]MBD2038893.1 hypothetical protein [Leptolyngbya sp. FACHB-321]
MNPELKQLTIAAKELEQLTGLEVTDLFIGGMVGGAYRSDLFKTRQRFLSFCLTQLFIFVLIFIFTLPIGLLLVRNHANSVNDVSTISWFLQVSFSVSTVVIVGWNVTMALKSKTLKPLAHLLDEVDKYNEIVQAVAIVERLDAIDSSQTHRMDRQQAIEALTIARNSLVCGLMTEKILRQNRGLLARRAALLMNIETNLTTLKTMEVTSQASEYVELLNEALQIGISVHQEVQQFSQR